MIPSDPLSDWCTLADDDEDVSTVPSNDPSRRDELIKPIEIKYRAKMHYSNWYASSEGVGTENNILKHQSSSGVYERDQSNHIKWEIGHLYFKKQYLKVMELIFSSIDFKHPSMHPEDEFLQNYFSKDVVYQFPKKFNTSKIPVVLKRELLDAFMRCLFKIVICYCINEKSEVSQDLKRTVIQQVITYYSVIEKEILDTNQQMAKSNRIPRSHKANFLLSIWDLKAQTQLLMAQHFLSKDEANSMVTSSVLLLQKCLHCKDSLLFILEEDGKKPKQHSQSTESENSETTSFDFRFTLVDTCYQTSVRSSSIWKHLAECYLYLGMKLCYHRSSYFSRSLTRINSLFNSLATKNSYSKEKIHTFPEEELTKHTIEECYLSNISNELDTIPFPTVEDAIAFDKKFAEVYLFNVKTIHSILSEQRGLKSTEDIDDSLIKRGDEDDDEDAPRTFDASQL